MGFRLSGHDGYTVSTAKVLGVWDWVSVCLNSMVTQFVPPKSGSVGFGFGSVGFGLRQSEHDGDTVRAAKVLGVWAVSYTHLTLPTRRTV